MLGQEALSRTGGWKRAMASGDQRCRNEGRSYEAKYCPLLPFVLPHLPCLFFFNSCLILLPCFAPWGFLSAYWKDPENHLADHHPHVTPTVSPSWSYCCCVQDSAGGEWRAEEGGMATSSTVPWQLLAKGRQKYKGTPDRYARLQLGAGEHLTGALCHVAAWVGMA